MRFGCQSMIGKIERVLVKHPRDAYRNDETLSAQWAGLNYSGCPDYAKAVAEFENFVALLERFIPEINYLAGNPHVSIDSIYAHDSVIITNRGAVLCNMTREQRRGEPAAMAASMDGLGIPILGAISGDGRLESGDLVWIDERTLAVGRGRRSNDEGIRQLRLLLRDLIDELIVVDLPEPIFHLMGIISLLDNDLAVIDPLRLPESFRNSLLARGFKLLEVPPQETATLACNILALAPRKCILLSGNPQSESRLRAEDVEVFTYSGEEISLKGTGGPTCLTRPLLRIWKPIP
jgi:N-dimethylarginine dimethylaminohydrolase